jgi:hypothetical protein
VQDLRDHALQRGDKDGGALDRDIRRHAGAGEADRKHLQRVDEGGFEIGKFALHIGGVFSYTRNPLYVGGTVALCGLALIFDLDWMLLLILPRCLFLHFAVIKREERYLEQKFGETYRRYKMRVQRYVN